MHLRGNGQAATGADDKAFVMDELRAKLDVDAAAGAAATPEEAAEIYTASLLAIDVDNAAERGYLAMLAARLRLDDALVAHLHGSVARRPARACRSRPDGRDGGRRSYSAASLVIPSEVLHLGHHFLRQKFERVAPGFRIST